MKKIFIVALVVAALLLTTNQRAAAQAMDPNTLKSRSGADFDLYFMRNIITNHQIDIELLRPAATNASHAPLKDLALSIMDKRQQEADQLIGWLNDWYHNQPDTSITATLIHMRAMPSMDMGSLNEALHQIYDLDARQGDAYDKQVLLYLIHDHQLAIAAAQLVPTRAARPELKPFAVSLIAEEQGEIDQFTTWLGQWYQVDSRGLPLTQAAATSLPASSTSPPASATSLPAPTATIAASAKDTINPATPTSVAPGPTVAPLPTATSLPPTAFIAPASDTATPTPLAPAPTAASGDNSGLWISVAVIVAAIVLLGWMALRRRPPVV